MRSRRLARCSVCGLHAEACICEGLPLLQTRTRIVIVAHRTELHKSTNTARLAARLLSQATLLARGDLEQAHVPPPGPGAWVLFPSADALPLSVAQARGLDTLVVPDGTWTQARRIARRDAFCRELPMVRLEETRTSTYTLRRNARPDGLCTLEAIAEALRTLEGPEVAEVLLRVFDSWVPRALLVRAGAHHQGRMKPLPSICHSASNQPAASTPPSPLVSSSGPHTA